MVDTADIESALIGSVLADPAANLPIAMSAGVRRTWFCDDAWAVTWDALSAIWDRGDAETADSTVVLAEAKKLAARVEDPTVRDRVSVSLFSSAIEGAGVAVGSYCAELKDAYLKRSLRGLLNREMVQADASSAEALGVSIRAGLDRLLSEATAGRELQVGAVFGRIMDEYHEAYQKRIVEKRLDWTPGLRMPWVELTRLMNGLRPGLHVLAARPSVGKTSFAVNLMRYWCDTGANVLFCSLDMPKGEALRRFLAERARVSVSKALFSPTKTDLAALDEARSVQVSLPLRVVEIRDVDEFKTFCMIKKSTGQLDVAVVDYLQLMHARALGREDAVEYARISYVSNALKELANQLEIPVVALCQLNRESTKLDRAGTMPGLADLRGSGSIEQDAFTVAILHRDAGTVEKWATPGSEPTQLMLGASPAAARNIDAVWWVLCKSQNGGTGQYPFTVWKPYFTWMLGNFAATALSVTTGYGSTQRTIADNSPKFSMVHADWRHDPLEAALAESGALLSETTMRDGPAEVRPAPPPPPPPAAPVQATFEGMPEEEADDDGVPADADWR